MILNNLFKLMAFDSAPITGTHFTLKSQMNTLEYPMRVFYSTLPIDYKPFGLDWDDGLTAFI